MNNEQAIENNRELVVAAIRATCGRLAAAKLRVILTIGAVFPSLVIPVGDHLRRAREDLDAMRLQPEG